MERKIKEFAKTLKVEYTGIVSAEPIDELRNILRSCREKFGTTPFEEPDIEKRVNPRLTLPEAESIIVCLFPYFSGDMGKSNISNYACIPDYHIIVKKYLEKICEFICKLNPAAKTLPFVDSGPLADKYLAYMAGLGFFGKNSLLINEKYGSFVFIGYIITDLKLKPDEPLDTSCGNCNKCIKTCPGNAISENYGFCAERCISYITQMKTVSESQKKILSLQNYVYGCDICQKVCPHNKNLHETPLEEFKTPKLIRLDSENIKTMSNREFKRIYGEFPFSWRGKSAILKNFDK